MSIEYFIARIPQEQKEPMLKLYERYLRLHTALDKGRGIEEDEEAEREAKQTIACLMAFFKTIKEAQK